MAELNTGDLEKILKSTHSEDFTSYMEENAETMIGMSNDFVNEIKLYLSAKGIKQRELFKAADITEDYGYKLLSGLRKTGKRDIILRILIASQMNIDQVQRLLRKYDMPELYAKIGRDALIMMAINEQKSINEINMLLKKNGFDILDRITAEG